MIKFILFFIFGGVSCVRGVSRFWYFRGPIVLGYLLFSSLRIGFNDYISLGFGLRLDMIGLSLIILSLWVRILIYLSSNGAYHIGSVEGFRGFVYFLMFILIVTFRVRNFFSFYFFFEASLVPTLLIILGWGYQPERLQAGIYFLFYTLAASLPLLLLLVYFYGEMGGLEIIFISLGGVGRDFISLFFLFL